MTTDTTSTFRPGVRVTWKEFRGTITRVASPISIAPNEPTYIVRLDSGMALRLTASQMEVAQ